MKILFLDWDGVCNRISDAYATPVRTINGIMTMAEPELVYRLNLLVDRTDAEIVLSSSWRHGPNWREAMRLSGVVREFLGSTPLRSDHKKYAIPYNDLCRGHNIQDWLDAHENIEKYAILDDASDMLASQMPNFFRTDTGYGLTQEIADAVDKHLRGSDSGNSVCL